MGAFNVDNGPDLTGMRKCKCLCVGGSARTHIVRVLDALYFDSYTYGESNEYENGDKTFKF